MCIAGAGGDERIEVYVAKDLIPSRQNLDEDEYVDVKAYTLEELKEFHKKSGLPLKRFFNTSGMKYKELQLKDKLPTMTEEEQYELLATDGMLVKRPIIVGDTFAIPGFKEATWSEVLK